MFQKLETYCPARVTSRKQVCGYQLGTTAETVAKGEHAVMTLPAIPNNTALNTAQHYDDGQRSRCTGPGLDTRPYSEIWLTARGACQKEVTTYRISVRLPSSRASVLIVVHGVIQLNLIQQDQVALVTRHRPHKAQLSAMRCRIVCAKAQQLAFHPTAPASPLFTRLLF